MLRARATDASGNVSPWSTALVQFGGSVDAAERLHAQRELGRRPGQRDRVRAGARRPALRRRAGRHAARRQERRAAGDAVRDRRRRLRRRARPDRRRLHPAFATNGFVYIYSTRSTAASRTTASAASPPTATSPRRAARSRWSTCPTCRARPTTTAAACTSAADGKLYVGVGENANGAQAQNLALPFGKLLRFNDDGTHPDRQPVLRDADRPRPRRLGLRPAQPVHLRGPAGHRPDPHQRRRRERPGKRSTSAPPAPTTAGRTRKGPTTSAPASPRRSSPTSTPTRRRSARARAASSRASRSPAARSIRPPARSPTATATSTTSPTTSAASSAASTSPTATPPMRSRACRRPAGRPARRQRRRGLRADAQRRDAHQRALITTARDASPHAARGRAACRRRHAAGGVPYSRRNARLNAVSVW